MQLRAWWVGVLVVVLAVLLGGPVAAHPGGLNSEGCHNNRKTGGYHCHGAPRVRVTPAVTRPAPRQTRRPAPARSWTTKAAPSKPHRRAPIKRSRAARAAFYRSNPCPVNGNTSGPCPGWEVDHIVPLACGGPDVPSNMQWLTAKANRSKGAMGCQLRR